MQETWVQSLGEDPPEKEMAIHSSTLAWEIPWTEETEKVGLKLNIQKMKIMVSGPAGDQPRLSQGIRRRDGIGEGQGTTA